jgi:hypothetical protein
MHFVELYRRSLDGHYNTGTHFYVILTYRVYFSSVFCSRRITLPVLVFGRSSTNCTFSDTL